MLPWPLIITTWTKIPLFIQTPERWIFPRPSFSPAELNLCAPSFVFLAGTALALSVERRVIKSLNAWEIDKGFLIRGAIIAIFDRTLISLDSGRWTFQVLFAIGLSMICMVPLQRLPTWALLTLSLGWIAFGELVTSLFWNPPGSSCWPRSWLPATAVLHDHQISSVALAGRHGSRLGLGRHVIRFAIGQSNVSGRKVLWICGVAGLLIFAVVEELQAMETCSSRVGITPGRVAPRQQILAFPHLLLARAWNPFSVPCPAREDGTAGQGP